MKVILRAELGKEFVIELDANPTTGYSWEASFDDLMLELVRQEYRRTSDLIGGGGRAVFTFLPRERGTVTIIMRYRRPWEPEAVQALSYEVDIS